MNPDDMSSKYCDKILQLEQMSKELLKSLNSIKEEWMRHQGLQPAPRQDERPYKHFSNRRSRPEEHNTEQLTSDLHDLSIFIARGRNNLRTMEHMLEECFEMIGFMDSQGIQVVKEKKNKRQRKPFQSVASIRVGQREEELQYSLQEKEAQLQVLEELVFHHELTINSLQSDLVQQRKKYETRLKELSNSVDALTEELEDKDAELVHSIMTDQDFEFQQEVKSKQKEPEERQSLTEECLNCSPLSDLECFNLDEDESFQDLQDPQQALQIKDKQILNLQRELVKERKTAQTKLMEMKAMTEKLTESLEEKEALLVGAQTALKDQDVSCRKLYKEHKGKQHLLEQLDILLEKCRKKLWNNRFLLRSVEFFMVAEDERRQDLQGPLKDKEEQIIILLDMLNICLKMMKSMYFLLLPTLKRKKKEPWSLLDECLYSQKMPCEAVICAGDDTRQAALQHNLQRESEMTELSIKALTDLMEVMAEKIEETDAMLVEHQTELDDQNANTSPHQQDETADDADLHCKKKPYRPRLNALLPCGHRP